MGSPYISPFAKPIYAMLEPVGSVCNLACEYCYYLRKGKTVSETEKYRYIQSQTLMEMMYGPQQLKWGTDTYDKRNDLGKKQ